jgi:hypothetical protein
MPSIFRIVMVLAVFSTLPSCGNRLEQSQTPGELGNGAFRYVCATEGDALCAVGEKATDFPERVATTSFFDVRFEPFGGSGAPRFEIVPAASGIIDEDSDILQAKAAGVVALLARSTSDGRVFDFIHIHVVDVAKIRLESGGVSPRLTWDTGKPQKLRAVPLDERGLVLAGGLSYEWETSDRAIVRVERANPAREMEFMPLSRGEATISVKAGARTEALVVTVQGKPIDLVPDAGSGSTDDGGARDAAPSRVQDGAAPPDATTPEGGSL